MSSQTWRSLNLNRDGIEGADLGIIGAWQYALTLFPTSCGLVAGDIYRRRADETGSYGGWRWECGSAHPARAGAELPEMQELARRVADTVAAVRGEGGAL